MNAEKIRFIEGTPVGIRVVKIKDYAPHWHDQVLEIVFVLHGSVNLVTSFENYTVDAGEFVLINQSEIHHIHGDGSNVAVLLYFDLLFFRQQHENIGYIYFSWESFNPGSNQKEVSSRLKRLLLGLMIEAGKQEPPDKEQINQQMQKIMNLLIYSFDIVHFYNDRNITKEQLHRYHGIIRFIEENYARKISMEELAKQEYMGKNYVSQFWKKIMDMNFTEFVNSRRVEISEKLLLTTDRSIQEISEDCGFSDPKYFYKNFKKWYQCTPQEHRKKYMEVYNKREDDYETCAIGDITSDLERILTEYYIEEERGNDAGMPPVPVSREKEIEKKIRSYSRVRIKKAIIKESQKEIDLRNIFIPLLNRRTAPVEGSRPRFDWNHIDTVLDFILEMNYVLCVEIDYGIREPGEWKAVMEEFAKYCRDEYGTDFADKLEYWIFYEDLDKAAEIKTLIRDLSGHIDPKKIKVAVRL